MTGPRKGFREHYNAARDFAISAAVLIYFVGIVYVYYYFKSFGVSLVSLQISPQQYYLFAYGVLTHDVGKTLLFVTVISGLVICYASGVDALASLEQRSRSKRLIRSSPVQFLQNFPLAPLHVLLTALGFAIVVVPFPIAFWWAQFVAAQDVTSKYLASHEESSRAIKLVENAKSIPVFSATIEKINIAGDEGRAVQIAETADRIFILVGAAVGPADNAELRLPNDRVFAVNKSLVAVEDIWEKQDPRR